MNTASTTSVLLVEDSALEARLVERLDSVCRWSTEPSNKAAETSVYSEPGKGTTFKIYFPRVDAPVDNTSVPERIAASPDGSETILLVEDSDSLRELTREFL